MTHQDHKKLLEKAGPFQGKWADLGSGDGAFTLALADLADKDIQIFSIDQDMMKLSRQRGLFLEQFPNISISYLKADISNDLKLPLLDGIILANVLHFFKDQQSLLFQLKNNLKQNGKLIIIEYNSDSGTIWVPYPQSPTRMKELLTKTEFKDITFLHAVPSEYLQEIYAISGINN